MTMSATIKAGLLLLLASIVLLGCKEVRANDDEFMKAFGLERKYYLKDCMVKLNFLWDSDTHPAVVEGVFQGIRTPISRAMVSGEFPYFSGHRTRSSDYYVFYFMDRCEDRVEYVRKLVEEKFLPNIPDFPRYEVEHEGIEPGFDGATPSCCWLDD